MRSFFMFWIYTAVLFLGGCGLFGPCGYDDPFAIFVYCKQHPTYPYDAQWVKSDMTPERRRADSKECGAGNPIESPTGGSIFTREQVHQEMLKPNEGFMGPTIRLRERWEVCMKSKGYEYLEKCDDVSCMYPLSEFR